MTNRIGSRVEELDTPCLCVDRDALEGNLRAMAEITAPPNARLRPHFKTHKSPAIAWMQLRAGAVGITCAKLGEAEVLAAAGVRDILIANQIVGPVKIDRLVGLASCTDVMAAVDRVENAADLDRACAARGVSLRVLVEVDVGMGRCGADPGREAVDLARSVSGLKALRFEGFMGYEGHAVMIPDAVARAAAAKAAMSLLVSTAELARSEGLEVAIVSAGGTGTAAVTARIPGVTEIQAGSYATMDGQYAQNVGVPGFRCALSLLATVVRARHETAIIDAGHKSLTSEFGLPLVADPPGWRFQRLSEEHGFLQPASDAAAARRPLREGDRVRIVPSHGCTTINLHDSLHVIRDGRLDAVWQVAGRGRSD